MTRVTVHCLCCQSAQVYRHEQNPKGHNRFRCWGCHRVFQLTYSYEARKSGVKVQITGMAFNGAGVRDTARTPRVGINTVIRTLKNYHYDESRHLR
ncbi:IS1-like element transposase [Pectobacterium versatile]|uniref:IS1-like element transposase n=1 Tax=Pectobacterium versatile TaxID=2488639 RepID=UPI003CD0DD8B